MKRIVAILVGLLFVGIGVFVLFNGKSKAKRCTIESEGTVVEIREESSIDSDGSTTYTYYPVVRYTAGKEVIQNQSNIGSSKLKYSINDKIDILYNPDNVSEFVIKGDNSLNFLVIIFIVLGSLAIIAGIVNKQ